MASAPVISVSSTNRSHSGGSPSRGPQSQFAARLDDRRLERGLVAQQRGRAGVQKAVRARAGAIER